MRASVSANGAGTTYLGGGKIGQVTVNVGGVGQVVIDPKNGAFYETNSHITYADLSSLLLVMTMSK